MTRTECHSHVARHLLPRKTPWLYFHRDHPLAHERWEAPKRVWEEEDYWDQMERLADILALDDDEDGLSM